MIWFTDNNLIIEFDSVPSVSARVIEPDMTTIEKNSIARYPFHNNKQIKITITDIDKKEVNKYEFCVYRNYCYDGASIPKMFWRIIGSNTDSRFLIPSMIHDVLCENHQYINHNRNLSSRIFKGLLLSAGVSKFKAQTMYLAVDNYQRFCGWNEKSQKSNEIK